LVLTLDTPTVTIVVLSLVKSPWVKVKLPKTEAIDEPSCDCALEFSKATLFVVVETLDIPPALLFDSKIYLHFYSSTSCIDSVL
jgi:hypothetical protein